MARGRMLNKKVSQSRQFQKLPDDTCRLLATWTIAHLDKNGVFHGDPSIVRALVLTLRDDVSVQRVAEYLRAMESAGLIRLFELNGQVWQVWPGFADNQTNLRKDRESSDYPVPPKDEPHPKDDGSPCGALPETFRNTSGDIPAEEKGREENVSEGKGIPPDPESSSMTPPHSFSEPTQSLDKSLPAPLLAVASTAAPAIRTYIYKTGILPNDLQKSAMLEVGDDARWPQVLDEWMMHGWNLRNVQGMIDRWRNGDKKDAKQTTGPAYNPGPSQLQNRKIIRFEKVPGGMRPVYEGQEGTNA